MQNSQKDTNLSRVHGRAQFARANKSQDDCESQKLAARVGGAAEVHAVQAVSVAPLLSGDGNLPLRVQTPGRKAGGMSDEKPNAMVELFEVAWFGVDWGSDLCAAQPRIATPVGELCYWCGETISESDDGFRTSNAMLAHRNCFMRQISGSLAHLEKRCSCYVKDSTCGDPDGMTKREAADAAAEYVRTKWTRRTN